MFNLFNRKPVSFRQKFAQLTLPYFTEFIKTSTPPEGKYDEESWKKMLNKMHWSLSELANGFANEPAPTGDLKKDKSARYSYNRRIGVGLKLFGRHIIYFD